MTSALGLRTGPSGKSGTSPLSSVAALQGFPAGESGASLTLGAAQAPGATVKGPLDVHHELLDAGIAHEIVHLPRRIVAADELPEALGVPSGACVVVRVFDSDVGPAAVVAPAGAVLNLGAVAAALGATTLREAGAQRVSQTTDFTGALVAPVGLPADLTVLADAALATHDVLYAPTGDGGTALKVHPGDLLRVIAARVDSLTSRAAVAMPRPRDLPAGAPASTGATASAG